MDAAHYYLAAYVALGIATYFWVRRLYRRPGHNPEDFKRSWPFSWWVEDFFCSVAIWPLSATLAWWSWYADVHRLRARQRYEAAKARVPDPNEKFQRMSMDELIAAQKKVLSKGPKGDPSGG